MVCVGFGIREIHMAREGDHLVARARDERRRSEEVGEDEVWSCGVGNS
ncbi:hypothetical protein [Haladaptatus litoreus]|nr:hypothetical protein [Haladaptatus litoreus]